MRTATERPASGLGLIDLHCHLLPGLDDGAKNRETTRAMAKAMAAQGVAGVVCTPHCTAGDPRLGERIAKIRMAMEEWKKLWPWNSCLCGCIRGWSCFVRLTCPRPWPGVTC